MRRVLILMAAVTLTSCSTLGEQEAPDCRGARRPANPHGSILAPGATEAVASPAITGPGGVCRRPIP